MSEEKLSNPFGESVLLKIIIIAGIALLLLIPSSWIQSLIEERSGRQQEVIKTVSDQWSGSQLIQGPVLIIPYKKQFSERNSTNKVVVKEYTNNLFVLPENLFIKAQVNTDTRKRGIFKVGVYKTIVHLTGNFTRASINKLQIDTSNLMLNKARLVFAISDLKGLSASPVVNIQNQLLAVDPILNGSDMLSNGLQATINLNTVTGNNIPFSFDLDIKGSEALNFVHTGKSTNVTVTSNWPNPKFDGRYLPDTNQVTLKGFNAKWHMLYYNRPFPQQWTNDSKLLNKLKDNKDALFGVELHIQVDDYQKAMRTSKYSILVILLTFVSLFLTEVIQKRQIHFFNYVLIGAALIVFYTLLLSFSEYVGYNLAYLIAAVATIALIAWFTGSLLANTKAAWVFAIILSVFYSFIFILIQLDDLSLLLGSIALFIIISVLMYFSRKISWE